jgi:anti-sigma B factor antagonist
VYGQRVFLRTAKGGIVMNIEQKKFGDVVMLSIGGDITMVDGGARRFADKVRSVLQQGDNRIVLDLGNVRFVDSAGLGELVQANSTVKNHDGALKLLNVTKRLNDLLVVTRLLIVFDCFDNEAEALASFEAAAAPR